MTKELIMMDQDRTKAVLSEVLAERIKQHEQWGDQRFPFHHPVDSDGHGAFGGPYDSMAQAFKDICDARRDVAQQGGPDTRSNALVLLEEVFEALAETDPARIREELIQVAAVAVKAIETLDREQR